MDDKSKNNHGYSTKNALIKLRDDIRIVIEEHKQKNRMGYLKYYYVLNLSYFIF